MNPDATRVSPNWLALREAADAAARAPALVEEVREHLAARPLTVIHDLGSGTGSMARWLAPQLPGKQRWILHDWDADLLERATANGIGAAADGAQVTVETRQGDITLLTGADLDGGRLVTASALLDLLTAAEVDGLAAACAAAGCLALLTLSVTGQVELAPADPLDAEITAAFNAHQRRTVGGRRLLGPDAPEVAAAAFQRHGMPVLVRFSPWQLGADQADLIADWLGGWVAAAAEARPELTPRLDAYAARRLADASAGRLSVTVHHCDILAACESTDPPSE